MSYCLVSAGMTGGGLKLAIPSAGISSMSLLLTGAGGGGGSSVLPITNLAVSSVTDTTIGLTWTLPVTTPATATQIIIVFSGGQITTPGPIDPAATSYTLSGLSPGTTYAALYVAFADAGSAEIPGTRSNTVSATTFPSATTGQTLVWRASLASTATINSGAPSNFTAVAGTGYSRKVGPTFGSDTDLSWLAPGWSLRVPYRQTVAGTPNPVFDGYYDLTGDTVTQTYGLFGGWFKFAGIPGGTSASRSLSLFGTFNTFGDVFLCSINVSLTASGATTLRFAGDNTSGTDTLDLGQLNQWIWIGIGWNIPIPATGGGNKTYACYAMLAGDLAPTLISSAVTGGANTLYNPTVVRCRAEFNEPSMPAVDPWFGAVGGLSLYSCDSLATVEKYAADIVPPVEQSHNWYASPVGSNGDGFSAVAGWDWPTLLTETSRGTILGSYLGWANGSSIRQTAASITTKALGNTLAAAIKAGTVTRRGDTVNFVGGITRVLVSSSQLIFEGVTGAGVVVASGSTLSARMDLSAVTWTRPDAGGNPFVWKYAHAGLANSVVEEGLYVLTPITAADSATALPLLNATARTCWADSTGVWIHAAASGNPNTDGLTRSCGVTFAQTATGAGLVAIGDGGISGTGTIDVGPMSNWDGATENPRYCGSSVTGCVGVVQNVTLNGGETHSYGIVGNDTTGFCLRWNVTYQNGYNLGLGWSSDVMYSSSASNGTIFGKWDGCQTTPGAAYHEAGQVASDDQLAEFCLTHGGGGATKLFNFVVVGCDFAGVLNCSLMQDSGVDFTTSTIGGILTDSVGATVVNCTFNTAQITVFAGDLTLTTCTIGDGGETLGSNPLLQGSLTLDTCTLDITSFDFVSNAGAVWKRDSATVFEMSGGTITYAGGNAQLLADGVSTDTILVSGTTFSGAANPTVFHNYDDGITTADRTYLESVALGLIVP